MRSHEIGRGWLASMLFCLRPFFLARLFGFFFVTLADGADGSAVFLVLGDGVVVEVAGAVVVAAAAAVFNSTWPLTAVQASHPPLRAPTFLKPLASRTCATRALVASLGQVQ